MRGRGNASESLSFQVVLVFASAATFLTTLCTLPFIVAIMNLEKEDRQKLCLMCVGGSLYTPVTR
jgi:hypothetical protein